MGLHFDRSNASCLVFTFKEGLMSRVAHDLKLRVDRFDIDFDPDAPALRGRFDARSIRVVNAMKSGREDPTALGDKDRRKIDRNIVTEILDPRRHPHITFTATAVEVDGDGYRVRGDLEIGGRTRAIAFRAHRRDGQLVAEARLHQPDWGIKPYSALLGTLRIQPDVEVVVSVPIPPS